MGGFLGGLLVLAAIIVMCLSVIAFFKPIKSLHLGTRMRALLGLGLSFLLLMAGVTPLPRAETISSGTPSTNAPTETVSVEPLPEEAKARVREFYGIFNTLADRCNGAFQRVSAETSSPSPNVQSLYNLAVEAKDQCRQTSMAFNSSGPPRGLRREQTRLFEAGLRTCALAYAGQQRSAEALMAAVDGGFRPSLVAEVQKLGRDALPAKHACSSQMAQAVAATGTDVSVGQSPS